MVYIPRASRDGVDVAGTLTQAMNQRRGYDGQLFYATDARKLLVWDYSLRGWFSAGGGAVYQAYAASGATPRFLADDFMGASIDSRYSISNGGGSGAASPAITAGVAGGECTLVTGTANGATACSSLTLALGWVPNQTESWQTDSAKQLLVLTAKAKMTAITSCTFFLGFSDVLAASAGTSQTPLYFSGATTLAVSNVNTGVSNAVGFLFDTGATLKQVQCVSSNAGTPTTPVDSSLLGTAITAATYLLYRVTVDVAGNAKFYIAPVPAAGVAPVWVLVGTILLGVAAAATLTPCACVASRSATSQTLTLDAWTSH